MKLIGGTRWYGTRMPIREGKKRNKRVGQRGTAVRPFRRVALGALPVLLLTGWLDSPKLLESNNPMTFLDPVTTSCSP